MEDFAGASRLEPRGDGHFLARIPDGWQQGRGAFGGLVLGILARAATAVEPDATRRLRTLSGDVCAPVLPGEAEIVTRVLRRGSNQSNVAVELVQNGAVAALASVVLSAPRPSPDVPLVDAPPPPADWRSLPRIPLAAPMGPVFAQHYEYRTDFSPPNMGVARCDGFVREAAPLSSIDAPALVARLDAWFPTLFQVAMQPRPMATVSFVAELLVDPATLPPTEPLRFRSRMAALHEGFLVELRELWHDGRPVALNQQTFVVIK
jgi:hypothetical protein